MVYRNLSAEEAQKRFKDISNPPEVEEEPIRNSPGKENLEKSNE